MSDDLEVSELAMKLFPSTLKFIGYEKAENIVSSIHENLLFTEMIKDLQNAAENCAALKYDITFHNGMTIVNNYIITE